MTSPPPTRPTPVPAPLGALEQRVIEVLWDHGTLTAREVIAALESDHAYTTITTVLSNLERKRMVTSRRAGRYVRHRPTRSRSEHAAELMEHALSTSHDRTASILHFLGTMNDRELLQLRQFLESQHSDPVGGHRPTSQR
ncbi:MAG TPA: BlaI/MecI/CopY family transcriptional regulator [Actinomycetaceae bacterium]|nr:BlaI/MecI/CopY family transcriptional regulator [Actinomycetaceae bacterium]